jgi:hypothetical protein
MKKQIKRQLQRRVSKHKNDKFITENYVLKKLNVTFLGTRYLKAKRSLRKNFEIPCKCAILLNFKTM